MKDTKIEYCDSTWSPWKGCQEVSPGCAHCFAWRIGKRFGWPWGKDGRGEQSEAYWRKPIAWNKAVVVVSSTNPDHVGKPLYRPRVLVDLCDPFDLAIQAGLRCRFFRLIEDTPNLEWLLLTKRALEMSKLWSDWFRNNPPPNAWLGVSAEDQPRALDRIPLLLQTKAARHWISLEPLIGPVDLCEVGGILANGLRGLDHVVVGGESGHGARPCNVGWIRSIRDQCKAAGVPCFVKQIGSNPRDNPVSRFAYGSSPAGTIHLDILHPKGGDPAEWPEDLRNVRQMPL